MIKLRPYQEKAIKAVLDSYDKEIRKVGIVMGVGTGKTITACSVIDEMIQKTGKKALILAHREELLTQAQEDLKLVNPKLTSSIEQGTNHADLEADVIIASVPTLGRGNSNRILKFDPNDFCMLWVDEAHHATNTTYTNIFEHFHTLKNVDDDNKRLLLGVTATPYRMDDQKLEDILDDIVYEYHMLSGIKQGYLSNIKAYTVKTNIDISQVKRSGGDFNLKDLGEAINVDERNKIILDTYKDWCTKQPTLIFCVDVSHAEVLTHIFKNEGIRAECVTGGTPTDERKKIIDDFKNRKVDVLMNVGIFTEGTNLPLVENIIMGRPTKSLGLYNQIIGRASRLSSGKTHATIYDIVDNAGNQGIKTMSSVLGIDELDFKGKDLLEIKDFVDKLKNLSPNINWRTVDVNNPKAEIERLDLLAGLNVPDELSPFTRFAWAKLSAGQYKLGLGDNKDTGFSYAMYLRENAIGKFEVYMQTYMKNDRQTKWVKIDGGLSMTQAIEKADEKVKKDFSDRFALIERSAPWRKQEPTDKQLAILRKLKVNENTLSEISKGQASVLLDKLFEEKPKKEMTQKQKNYLRWKGNKWKKRY